MRSRALVLPVRQQIEERANLGRPKTGGREHGMDATRRQPPSRQDFDQPTQCEILRNRVNGKHGDAGALTHRLAYWESRIQKNAGSKMHRTLLDFVLFRSRRIPASGDQNRRGRNLFQAYRWHWLLSRVSSCISFGCMNSFSFPNGISRSTPEVARSWIARSCLALCNAFVH